MASSKDKVDASADGGGDGNDGQNHTVTHGWHGGDNDDDDDDVDDDDDTGVEVGSCKPKMSNSDRTMASVFFAARSVK